MPQNILSHRIHNTILDSSVVVSVSEQPTGGLEFIHILQKNRLLEAELQMQADLSTFSSTQTLVVTGEADLGQISIHYVDSKLTSRYYEHT